ncbi:hypothetical protein ACE7GA_12960 [Roseomonas sp. CCTCC AB2023176]|uniref:hypothetical protein n=1 Tax=Roseomonas sp. CCTCC AB2023176 TaxID=3342640 RepID=UPI0035D84730
MDVLGREPSTVKNDLNARMRLLHGAKITRTIEEIPRAFPPPPLRARYRLNSGDRTETLVEPYVGRTAEIRAWPELIARPVPAGGPATARPSPER